SAAGDIQTTTIVQCDTAAGGSQVGISGDIQMGTVDRGAAGIGIHPRQSHYVAGEDQAIRAAAVGENRVDRDNALVRVDGTVIAGRRVDFERTTLECVTGR